MINNIELSIKAYIQARKRVNEGYDAYISQCNEHGKNTVVLSEDIEPFVSIREAISWAVSLYEKIPESAKDEDVIRFMSGIKFLDNRLKHNKGIFSLYTFCRPGIKISVAVDDNEETPIIREVSMEPTLVFGNAENIFEGAECQLKNYLKEVQGKSIRIVMDKLDQIINKFYLLRNE
jgi:hypothetical protein